MSNLIPLFDWTIPEVSLTTEDAITAMRVYLLLTDQSQVRLLGGGRSIPSSGETWRYNSFRLQLIEQINRARQTGVRAFPTISTEMGIEIPELLVYCTVGPDRTL